MTPPRRRRPSISQAMRQAVARRYGAGPGERISISCAYCPTRITIEWTNPDRVRFLDADGRATPELDHVEPLVLGGPHTVDNLVSACLRCNRSKGAKRLASDLAHA